MGIVPLVDLKAQARTLSPALEEAVLRVLRSGHYVLGEEVARFEKGLARYLGAKYVVGVSSGTDALVLILRALGVGPGDEVIVPSFTFFATAEAVTIVGAVPVFCDVEEETLLMSARLAEKKLTPKTRAVIVVHLFGQSPDMDQFRKLCRRTKTHLIEDMAQAIGCRFRGRSVGTFGAAGAVSFYPSKNLGAAGDAGAVVTNSARIAKLAFLLRVHGGPGKYRHKMCGYNSRLDAMQAAILNVKLPHVEAWNERRRKLAAAYRAHLADLAPDVVPVQEAEGSTPVYHLFVVRAKRRNQLVEHLRRQGVLVQVHYPLPLPFQPALGAFVKKGEGFPTAQQASREVVSLPLYPEMKEADVKRVCRAVATFYRTKRGT